MKGSTAPECLQVLRTSQACTRYAATTAEFFHNCQLAANRQPRRPQQADQADHQVLTVTVTVLETLAATRPIIVTTATVAYSSRCCHGMRLATPKLLKPYLSQQCDYNSEPLLVIRYRCLTWHVI
jgi:hypothetical protein